MKITLTNEQIKTITDKKNKSDSKKEILKFAEWCSNNNIDFSGQNEHTVNHYYYEDIVNEYLSK